MTIIVLKLELALLRELNLLYVESLEIGCWIVEIYKIDIGVDLICKQKGFLVIYLCLAYKSLDKKIVVGDVCGTVVCLPPGTTTLLLWCLPLGQHLDGERVRCILLAVNHHRCSGNGNIALVVGNHNVGVGYGLFCRNTSVDIIAAHEG